MAELAEDKVRVYDAAVRLLEVINQVYLENGEILPTRQYVTGGRNSDAAHDCEQVVVAVEQLYNGSPGMQVQEATGCEHIRSVVFTVEIVRDQPVTTNTRGGQGTPPSPEKMNEAFRKQAIDMQLLLDSGLTFSEGTFFGRGLGDVNIGPRSGGMQGVILSLVAALD